MPTKRPPDILISKIVSMGVSKTKAESIVSGLNDAQITRALTNDSALKSIIDIPTRNR